MRDFVFGMAVTFVKYFFYVGYSLFAFNAVKGISSSGPLWKIWLIVLLSLGGCFALVRASEEFLMKRGVLSVRPQRAKRQ